MNMNTTTTIMLTQLQNTKENVLAQSPSSNNKMFEWSLSGVKPVNCPLLDIPTRLSNAVWELMCKSTGHFEEHSFFHTHAKPYTHTLADMFLLF